MNVLFVASECAPFVKTGGLADVIGAVPKALAAGEQAAVDEASDESATEIFHAGTSRNDDGSVLATGGRVLNVTGIGQTVQLAQKRAYDAIDKIHWPQGFCRTDIGWRAIARELDEE